MDGAHAREHQSRTVGQLDRFRKHFQRAPRQRHPVLAIRLHALGRHRPRRPVEIDLVPGRPAHLARASRGEHQELVGESRLPALQQDVDSERSSVPNRCLLEAVDDVRGVVNIFSDFRFVPTTLWIVVSYVALALHVDKQDGEGSDLWREFPDGRLSALRAGVSML